MARAKRFFVVFRCTECQTPGKVTKRSKKPLPEMNRFCRKCRKHTKQKTKDVKKAAK